MFLHMIRVRQFARKVASFCTSKNHPQIYTYPYNVNQEQQKSYLQQVQRQINTTLTAEVNPIPRRKRRLYDRPKYDENIEHFGAWRVFGDQKMILLGE